MTVKELVEKLQQIDQNLPVCYYDGYACDTHECPQEIQFLISENSCYLDALYKKGEGKYIRLL